MKKCWLKKIVGAHKIVVKRSFCKRFPLNKFSKQKWISEYHSKIYSTASHFLSPIRKR